jgi:hypothetical protein
MDQWATGTTGRAVYREINQPNRKDSVNLLLRRLQNIIFRLPLHPIKSTFKYNPASAHPYACPICDCPSESVQHILFKCHGLNDVRAQLLHAYSSIANSLYGNHHQLKNTCKYFKMTLCRRVRAQQPSGSKQTNKQLCRYVLLVSSWRPWGRYVLLVSS